MTSPGPFAYVGKPTPSREAPRFVRGTRALGIASRRHAGERVEAGYG